MGLLFSLWASCVFPLPLEGLLYVSFFVSGAVEGCEGQEEAKVQWYRCKPVYVGIAQRYFSRTCSGKIVSLSGTGTQNPSGVLPRRPVATPIQRFQVQDYSRPRFVSSVLTVASCQLLYIAREREREIKRERERERERELRLAVSHLHTPSRTRAHILCTQPSPHWQAMPMLQYTHSEIVKRATSANIPRHRGARAPPPSQI